MGKGQRFEHPQAVLRAVLESPKEIVVFALDREYRYLAFNENHARTMQRIWGAKIHVGDRMLDIIGRQDDRFKAAQNFDRVLAGESFTLVEEYGDELMDRRFWENVYSPIVDERGVTIGLTVFLSDISKQRREQIELENYRTSLEALVKSRTEELEVTHARLLHARKLESLGVLAGGIAHDFNNLLAVILGRTELATPLLREEHAVRAHLEIIRESALEGRMLTKQLLGYSGKGKLAIQQVDLSELVRSMKPLLRASVSPAIALTVDLSDEPVVAELDATQLRQLVLNLVTNAAQAIGEGPGEVTVRARVLDADEAMLRDACMQSGVTPGRYASFEVEDTGCGMNEVVRSKLFDPFFTTKSSGRGLGLAAALGTVTGHHGTILLRTAPGEGAHFTVLFPLIDEVASVEAPPRIALPPRVRARGTALVIDDEEPVRAVLSEVLGAMGYQVLQAETGRAACDRVRDGGEGIEVVLLDLTMPDMSGEEMLSELKTARPDVPVIVLTAYTADEARKRFRCWRLGGVVTKPFLREELVSAVDAAVDAATPDA